MSTEKHQHKPTTTLQPTAPKQEETVLAKQLRQGWASVKSGSGGLWLWGIVILMIIGAYFGWEWYSRTNATTESGMWVRFQVAETTGELQELAEDEAAEDALQGRLADLQRARLLSVPQGILRLGTTLPKAREDAIENLKTAREIYRRLAEEFDEGSNLQLQALWGAASVEESLVGVPTGEGSSEHLGSLDQVIADLRKIAGLADGQPMGKQAADKADRIEQNKDQIRSFYVQLNERMKGFSFDPTPPDPVPGD